MTPLAAILHRQIAATGPISLADYMALCLLHPEHGYYTTATPFGAKGDFTTAPEISQMFGELLGLALAQAWIDQGRPAPFTLAELGPGQGTLMTDVLRATRAVPGFHAAMDIHLIEASDALRKVQAAAIPNATFHDSAAALPDAPLFLIANEFFDALPIRQFQRSDNGWAERVIGQDGETLVIGLSPPAPLANLQDRLDATAPGDVIEVCPALPGIIAQVTDRIARNGGVAIIIDYGDWNSTGNTFQAVRQHQKVDPLVTPGQADLTAHVNFAAIATACDPTTTASPMTPQGIFLERLGIVARAQALAANLSGHALENHIAAHRRLTAPDEMGQLFKVIGLSPAGSPPIPGLTQ